MDEDDDDEDEHVDDDDDGDDDDAPRSKLHLDSFSYILYVKLYIMLRG